jgi:hypothetical protein
MLVGVNYSCWRRNNLMRDLPAVQYRTMTNIPCMTFIYCHHAENNVSFLTKICGFLFSQMRAYILLLHGYKDIKIQDISK